MGAFKGLQTRVHPKNNEKSPKRKIKGAKDTER